MNGFLRDVVRTVALTLALLLSSIHPFAFAQFPPAQSFGTGFAVTKGGHVLTSYHVVKGARDIRVFMPERESRHTATLVAFDERADFALLKVDIATEPLKVSDFSTVPVGIEVFSLGFPQPSIQGRSLKITSGILNSLEGWKGDKGSFQFSAPTQRGNSGGPVLTADGSVLGLIQGKLGVSTRPIERKSADIPQNVNFASNSRRISEFLSSHAVPYQSQAVQPNLVPRAHEVYTAAKASVYAIEVVAGDTREEGRASGRSELSTEVRLLLERLDRDDQVRLLGAIKFGFDSVVVSGRDVLMIGKNVTKDDPSSQWSEATRLLENSEAAFGTILSFPDPRIHPKGFSYRSVLLIAGFNCESNRLRVVYREYKEYAFGGGRTLAKLIRTKGDPEAQSRELQSITLRRALRGELCTS